MIDDQAARLRRVEVKQGAFGSSLTVELLMLSLPAVIR